MKTSLLNRLLLLFTGLLAAYQIAVGIEGQELAAILCYTVTFGVLLVAALLLLVLGLDVLDSPFVVLVSTLIPLSLSMGLVVQFFPEIQQFFLLFTVLGYLLILVTRFSTKRKVAALTLAVVHGVAGVVIFIAPFIVVLQGRAPAGFALVGIGGALIGLGGLLLSFLRAGHPILTRRPYSLCFPDCSCP